MSERPAAMVPALLALLPALALSAWTRAQFAPDLAGAQEPEPAGQVVLEVLIAEGGYRLRRTTPDAHGWKPPLRTARRTTLGASETFVPRGPGLPDEAVLAAATMLLDGASDPLVQLRAEDAMPWATVLAAGAALEPLLGRPMDADSLLAGMLVDARP